jgi:very-short-patch-repair endonuclease
MLFRVSIAAACILLGFAFFPMFLIGAIIAWSIVQDIREAPERRAREAELYELARAPVSAQNLRDACESPAEVAFLDAMIDAYELKTGEGALEGGGLRLTSQKGMGAFRVFSQGTSHQYRADFLVDGNLVVEIDGAAYHSTPEAVARDKNRDADLAREGYQTLRIPARDVFQSPSKAIAAVESAREALRKGRPAQTERAVSAPTSHATPEERRPLLSRVAETLNELDARSKRFHAAAVIDNAIGAILSDIEVIVENASKVAAMKAPPTTTTEDERREANGIWLRKIVEAVNAEPGARIEKQAACSEAVKAISRSDAHEYCERAVERSVDAHMPEFQREVQRWPACGSMTSPARLITRSGKSF